ncbi:SpoIID/LytB domain-containing protein [bacterium]|nr:SpoIID/LytB domain-containing protein [bacterium]
MRRIKILMLGIMMFTLNSCTTPVFYRRDIYLSPRETKKQIEKKPAVVVEKSKLSSKRLPETIIRIGVLPDARSVCISSEEKYEVIDIFTSEKISLEKGKVYKVMPQSRGISVGTYLLSSQISFVPLSGDYGIKVNKRRYRDTVVIKKKNNHLIVINELGIEGYVCGIMTQEVSPLWPAESLKAQAVVARTYALKHMGKHRSQGFDLCDTTHCQVFNGIQAEDSRTNQAVYATWGEVLTYQGKIAKTFCHSCCGGHTESESGAWGGAQSSPYLKGVTCRFCKEAPHYKWERRLSLHLIEKTLRNKGYSVGKIKRLVISERNSSGRVKKVKIVHSRSSLELRGSKFRALMGYQVIRSSLFNMRREGEMIKFFGRGWGHGVGFCQWGAKGLSLRGYKYKRILNFYYPHTRLEKWSE